MHVHIRLYSLLFVFLFIPFLSGCFVSSSDEELLVSVVAYGGEPFTAADVHKKWHVEVVENTVMIQQVVEPDAFENRVYYLELQHKEGEFPEVIDVWYGPQGGGLSQRTKVAGVAIQSWDIKGEISGFIELVSVLGERRGERFWVDSSAQ